MVMVDSGGGCRDDCRWWRPSPAADQVVVSGWRWSRLNPSYYVSSDTPWDMGVNVIAFACSVL
ncbi:hypothetical protein HanRHA438_Chr03g0131781 [Helianthus annuus]|nr:hypothetical protein HanRHA438_Chr03g0131781 [Helianthus annuus]